MGSYPASEYVSGHIGLRSFHLHIRNLSDHCKKLLIFFLSKLVLFVFFLGAVTLHNFQFIFSICFLIFSFFFSQNLDFFY